MLFSFNGAGGCVECSSTGNFRVLFQSNGGSSDFRVMACAIYLCALNGFVHSTKNIIGIVFGHSCTADNRLQPGQCNCMSWKMLYTFNSAWVAYLLVSSHSQNVVTNVDAECECSKNRIIFRFIRFNNSSTSSNCICIGESISNAILIDLKWLLARNQMWLLFPNQSSGYTILWKWTRFALT